jgi:hypothetical protein
MFGKAIVEGLGLIDVDLESCPYQTLTLMDESKIVRGITKHEVICCNPSLGLTTKVRACEGVGQV